jgi:hypothetical protein
LSKVICQIISSKKTYLFKSLFLQDVFWIDISIRVFILGWLWRQLVPWLWLQILGMCSYKSFVIIRVLIIRVQSDPVIKLLGIDALWITDRLDAATFPYALANTNIGNILQHALNCLLIGVIFWLFFVLFFKCVMGRTLRLIHYHWRLIFF